MSVPENLSYVMVDHPRSNESYPSFDISVCGNLTEDYQMVRNYCYTRLFGNFSLAENPTSPTLQDRKRNGIIITPSKPTQTGVAKLLKSQPI